MLVAVRGDEGHRLSVVLSFFFGIFCEEVILKVLCYEKGGKKLRVACVLRDRSGVELKVVLFFSCVFYRHDSDVVSTTSGVNVLKAQRRKGL